MKRSARWDGPRRNSSLARLSTQIVLSVVTGMAVQEKLAGGPDDPGARALRVAPGVRSFEPPVCMRVLIQAMTPSLVFWPFARPATASE